MKSFLHSLISDPLRKFISLFLALVLYWALNEGKQREEEIDNVHVTIECDDDVFLSDMYDSRRVSLTVRGSESRIKKLERKDISGKVRLSRKSPGFDEGMVILDLSPRDFTVPRGIEVVKIKELNTKSVRVQPRISRFIPVKAEIIGRVPAGWVCSSVKCRPEKILVSGPESIVANLQEIVTEPLNIDGETATFHKTGMLLRNPGARVLTFDNAAVTVLVEISRMPDARRYLKDVPVRCLLPPQSVLSVALEKSVVGVTVSGPQSEVGRISAKDLMVFADLSDPKYAVSGEHLVQLQGMLNNPEGKFRVVAVDPQEIRIKTMVVEKNKKK